MKTIQLTPQQRNEIGQRRRQAQDRRIYQRLSTVLWIDAGRSREEVAELLGVSTRQVGQWLRIFRNKGLEELCTLHYKGDPGRLRPAQIEQLKHQIATGMFHNTEQVRCWIQETFGVAYSATGVKNLLHRIGASYHKVSGSFGKADDKEQKEWVRKYGPSESRSYCATAAASGTIESFSPRASNCSSHCRAKSACCAACSIAGRSALRMR